MSEYGIFQTLRYFFIAGFILLFAKCGFSREWLLQTFFFAELLLFLVECPFVLKGGVNGIKISKGKMMDIFKFGYQILPANLVLELNSKADVLCLSFVTGDEKLVGIYSFAVYVY